MRIPGSWLVLGLLLGGCPSTSVYRSANPLEPGQWSFSAATGAGSMKDIEQESTIPTGHVELSARRGIREDLDMGLKLYLAGSELNATWRVHRGDWSVALAPYVSVYRSQESPATSDALHLFAGSAAVGSRDLAEKWTLSTGPLAGYGLYAPSTGGSAQGAWLGAFVNVERRIGDHWALVPELSLYRVVTGDVPVDGGSAQLGLGLRWTP